MYLKGGKAWKGSKRGRNPSIQSLSMAGCLQSDWTCFRLRRTAVCGRPGWEDITWDDSNFLLSDPGTSIFFYLFAVTKNDQRKKNNQKIPARSRLRALKIGALQFLIRDAYAKKRHGKSESSLVFDPDVIYTFLDQLFELIPMVIFLGPKTQNLLTKTPIFDQKCEKSSNSQFFAYKGSPGC